MGLKVDPCFLSEKVVFHPRSLLVLGPYLHGSWQPGPGLRCLTRIASLISTLTAQRGPMMRTPPRTKSWTMSGPSLRYSVRRFLPLQQPITSLVTHPLLPFSRAGFSEETELLVAHVQQQRLVLAAALLLGQSEKTGPNREVRDFSWDEHVRYFTDAEFKLRYRVSWDSFNTLLRILEPGLRVANEAQAIKSRSGKPIELSTRLAVALRYFAGGCPLDLICIYKMGKTQVFRCIWLVVDAVNTHLKNIHFPIDDADALAELELGFRAATRGDFWRGQVGAIDGVHFKMRAPTNEDVDNPMRYYVSRKETYALLAMAICDVNRRFLWADISHTSTTHDSTAWTATELGQAIAQGELPEPYFLNGDAAFTLGPSMITPSNKTRSSMISTSTRVPIAWQLSAPSASSCADGECCGDHWGSALIVALP